MKASFVIFADDQTLQVASVYRQEVKFFPAIAFNATSQADGAKSLHGAFESAEYDGSGIMLAIPSAWCLTATIAIGDLPRRSRRALMIYRLEEHLPLAAEDLVIDFSLPSSDRHRSGVGRSATGDAMGVCTATTRLSEIIKTLDAAGVYVQSIVPTALLAAQEVMMRADDQNRKLDVIVWTAAKSGSTNDGARSFECLEIRSQAVVGWTTLADFNSVAAHLRHLNLCRCGILRLAEIDLAEQEQAQLKMLEEVTLQSPADLPGINCATGPLCSAEDTTSIHAAAARHAARVLAGENRAPVEFRRDSLAAPQPLRRVRVPVAMVIAASIMFALSSAASMLMLSRAYEARSSKYQAIERQLYREAKGGQSPLGSNIVSQLLREDQRLKALSGTLDSPAGLSAGGHSSTPPSFVRPRSALIMLHEILTALPTNFRLRILEVQLSPDQVEIDGQTRTHGDADAIADGLRSLGSYAVNPPHSEVHGNEPGVSFTITAKPLLTRPDVEGLTRRDIP